MPYIDGPPRAAQPSAPNFLFSQIFKMAGYPKKKYASKSKAKKTTKKSYGKRYKNGSGGSYSNNRSSYTRKSSGGTSYANHRNKRRSTGQGSYSRASISTEGTYGKRAGGLGRAVTKSVIAPLRDTATGVCIATHLDGFCSG